MWDKREFEKVDFMARRFSVSVVLKGVANGFEWICLGVYGPTDGGLGDVLWAKLDIVRSWWLLAWCLFGDFNIIGYLTERLGCSLFNSAMFKF